MIHLIREQFMAESHEPRMSLSEYFELNKANASRRVMVRDGETVVAQVLNSFPPKVYQSSNGRGPCTSTSILIWIGQFNAKTKSSKLTDKTGVNLRVVLKKKEGDQSIAPDGLLETVELREYSVIFVSTLKISGTVNRGDIVYVRGLHCTASHKDGKYGYFFNATMVEKSDIDPVIFYRILSTRPPPVKMPIRQMLNDYSSDNKTPDMYFYVDLGRKYDPENYRIESVKQEVLDVNALVKEDNQNKTTQRLLSGFIMLSNEAVKEKIQLNFFIGKDLLNVFHIQDTESWKAIMSIIYGKLTFGLKLKTSLADSSQYLINENKSPDVFGDTLSSFKCYVQSVAFDSVANYKKLGIPITADCAKMILKNEKNISKSTIEYSKQSPIINLSEASKGIEYLIGDKENVEYYVLTNYALTDEYIENVPLLSPQEGTDLLMNPKGKKTNYKEGHPIHQIVLVAVGPVKQLVFAIFPDRISDLQKNEENTLYRFSYDKVEESEDEEVTSKEEENTTGELNTTEKHVETEEEEIFEEYMLDSGGKENKEVDQDEEEDSNPKRKKKKAEKKEKKGAKKARAT